MVLLETVGAHVLVAGSSNFAGRRIVSLSSVVVIFMKMKLLETCVHFVFQNWTL
jgi:hypothetical protein